VNNAWPSFQKKVQDLRAHLAARSAVRQNGWTHFLDPNGSIVSYGPPPPRRSPTFKRRP
jgi:hypothetical protein